MSEPRLVEISFNGVLNTDCMIVCDHFHLNNSIINWGIDFTKPMLFNEFLKLIGTHLTGFNCKSLLKQARWYAWTCDSDDVIEKYYK